MRVLHVTNMYPRSEAPNRGIFVQRLERALRTLGVESRLVEVRGFAGKGEYLSARRTVRNEIRTYRPDVVHVHFGYTILAVPEGSARVVSFYGDDLNGVRAASGRHTISGLIGIAVSQWAARACERSIAVSRALRDRIWTRAARSRCRVVPDAVDVALFRPGDQRRSRQALGLPESPGPLILFPYDPSLGVKRVQLARATVGMLQQWLPSAALWVVHGRAPDEMPDVYRAADAMLVTSITEGGPSSAKEAVACGTPVVSVDVGDMTDMAGRFPRVCTVGEPEPSALAAALRKSLALPRSACTVEGEELDYRTSAEAVLRVYHEAIQARASGGRG